MRTLFFILALALLSPNLVSATEHSTVTAPNFTLKSNSGKNLQLSEQRGQVIMLNFWASWCGPCRKEMPYLEALYKKYKHLGFTVWGLNVDENSNNAKTLLDEIKVSFPILFDPKNKIPEKYELEAMPSTYMIDRDGKIRFAHQGYLPGYEQTYEKQIKQLVME